MMLSSLYGLFNLVIIKKLLIRANYMLDLSLVDNKVRDFCPALVVGVGSLINAELKSVGAHSHWTARHVRPCLAIG